MTQSDVSTDFSSRIPNIKPFILAGGKSRRFGSNKAFASIDGVRQIDRLLQIINVLFQAQSTIVCSLENKPQFAEFETLTDFDGSRGPLSGIAAALVALANQNLASNARTNSKAESFALIVTCDSFSLSARTMERLASARSQGRDIVAYKSPESIQPFPSLWSSRIADKVARAAVTEQRSVIQFIAQHPSTILLTAEHRDYLQSFNTVEELTNLQRVETAAIDRVL